MTTVTLASSKPPITLTSARGITITVDRSVSTSSGGGSGTVTSVTGSAPVVITGTVTVTPNVTITAATTGAAGSMSSADKTKLDGIGTGATVTGVTGTAPIVSSGGAAPAISVTTGFAASTVAAGDDARIVSLPLYVSGQFTANTSTTPTTAGIISNRLYYLPYLITTSTTFDRMAIEHLGAVGGALSVVRMGIYTSSAGLPSTRVLDAGTIDLTTALAFKTITISQTLTPGLYFLAVVAQVTSGAPTFRTAVPTIVTPDSSNIVNGVKFEAAAGALPATSTPGVANTTTVPIAWMRKA